MKYRFAYALLLISALCTEALAQAEKSPSSSAPAAANITQQAALSNPLKSTGTAGAPTSEVDPNEWNCNLYAAFFNFWRLEIVITTLSTYRLQNCPSSIIDKTSVASVAAQLRTVAPFSAISKSGSFRQVMDINLTPITNEYFWVSNLKFSVLGEARLSLKHFLETTRFKETKNLKGASYETFRFYGDTHYIWNTGTLVHRLVSPNGHAYIMTSYTSSVQPALTREKLSNLSQMLRMPIGWRFENYFLDKTVIVRASAENDNSVEILFDDLNNFYVRYE